jgi:fibronectin type 3 domain-containing protein
VAGFDVSISSGLSGATIAPGQTAILDVTFAPKSAEQLIGSVKVTNNAVNSPPPITLSGTGVSASAPSVALTWDASMSAEVVGYKVYRATPPSTTDTKLVSAPVSGLTYMDQTVAAGTTYNYVVTAVNSSGEESAYSVPATVVLL